VHRQPVAAAAAGVRAYTYVGRRKPGATLAVVQAQVAAAAQRLDNARPTERRGTRISVKRVWLNDPAENIAAVIGFMAVPLLVLIIACVNAGNLLLARASQHIRDWQVRLALGASSWRIVRQVLAECLILSLLAAGGSLLVTTAILQFVASSVPIPMPLDGRVQLFTIAVTVIASLAFGLGPALRLASRGMDGAFNTRATNAPARSRVRSALIALQAAVSLGLLATGAQFVNTARTGFGRTIPEGADRLLIASFDVDPLNMSPQAADTFYARVLEQTAGLGGVVAAAFATDSPLGTFGSSGIRLWLPNEDRPEGRRGLASVVSGRYFQATRAPLIAGRYFTSADEGRPPRTAIVNEAFSRRYLASAGPGVSLRVAAAEAAASTQTDVEIVGVVGPEYGLKRDVPVVYLPAPLSYSPARSLYVQFDDSGRFSVASLQQAVREVDYRVPIRRAATLRDQETDTDAERRLLAGGTAALGVFALALAAGGLYGVVSYLVALRRREIGVRLALGASRGAIVRLILRQGLIPAATGAVVGAGAAIAIGLVVRSRLYGAALVDPSAFAGATLVLAVALVAACILPARHAARIDPAITLRAE
jgi:predicted permease